MPIKSWDIEMAQNVSLPGKQDSPQFEDCTPCRVVGMFACGSYALFC